MHSEFVEASMPNAMTTSRVAGMMEADHMLQQRYGHASGDAMLPDVVVDLGVTVMLSHQVVEVGGGANS